MVRDNGTAQEDTSMMTSMPTALRIVGHVGVFLLAVVVFYLGLGVGLALNPLLGMLLWAVAVAIGVLNVKWMLTRDSS